MYLLINSFTIFFLAPFPPGILFINLNNFPPAISVPVSKAPFIKLAPNISAYACLDLFGSNMSFANPWPAVDAPNMVPPSNGKAIDKAKEGAEPTAWFTAKLAALAYSPFSIKSVGSNSSPFSSV